MALTRDYLTDARLLRAIWTLSADDPGGDELEAGAWGAKSVQAVGRFGPASVVVEATNTGTDWTPVLAVRHADLVSCPLTAWRWRVRLLDPGPQTAVVVAMTGTRSLA